MFRILNRNLNRKGQNTAEYALLISLVVAAIIAMQTYVQRALHGRIRDAAIYLKTNTSELGNTEQCEPYSTESNYTQTSDRSSTERLDTNIVSMGSFSNRVVNGQRTEHYNAVVGQ